MFNGHPDPLERLCSGKRMKVFTAYYGYMKTYFFSFFFKEKVYFQAIILRNTVFLHSHKVLITWKTARL